MTDNTEILDALHDALAYIEGNGADPALVIRALHSAISKMEKNPALTDAQREALKERWESNPTINEPFDETKFTPQFDLPEGWVAGWLGSIFVGCSPEGNINS